MAGKSYKTIFVDMSPDSAISTFYAEVEELASEAREIVDNASEGLSQTQRIQTFDETASTLEDIQEVDVPDEPEGVEGLPAILKVGQSTPRSRADRTSRAVRLENACAAGTVGCDAIEAWIAAAQEALEDGADEPEWIDEWTQYIDEVREHISAAESVEFPGMYG